MKAKNGFVMVTVLVLMILLGILATIALNTSLKGVQTSSTISAEVESFVLAESGINIGAQLISDEQSDDVLISEKFNSPYFNNSNSSLLQTLISLEACNGTTVVDSGKNSRKTQIFYKHTGVSDGESLDMTSKKMHGYTIYSVGSSNKSKTFIESTFKKLY